MDLRSAINVASGRLSGENARRDAETLLLDLLGRDRAWLFAHADERLTAAQNSGFKSLVARRAAHEPLQYITGKQEFFGLEIAVTPAVLIPRPETELLVAAVLDWAGRLPSAWADHPLQLVDVGTGSGAIALALAAHLPQARVTALDLSPAALSVAEANADRLGLTNSVGFVRSDLLEALQERVGAGERLDVIVSNPPYIPDSDEPTLQPEVRSFEPHSALFAGPDGLSIYRRLIPQALTALRSGGLLALEFGFGQRAAIEGLLSGWTRVQTLVDLAGIPRVALAQRP